jgi:hypothetical protein
MIWFFERDDESLRLETQYDEKAAEYVVSVRYADGQQRVERFKDLEAFQIWIETFDRELAFDHWISRSGPIILPYGWPNKRVM